MEPPVDGDGYRGEGVGLMDDVTATVGRAGATVLLRAPGDAIAALVRLGSPFLDVNIADAPLESAPSVRVVREAPAGPGWNRLVSASAYEPDRVVWVHERLRAVALVDESTRWRDQQVLRPVPARWTRPQ